MSIWLRAWLILTLFPGLFSLALKVCKHMWMNIPVVCSLFVLPKHFRCIQAFFSRPGAPKVFHVLTKVARSTFLCHTTRTATSALSFYTFNFNHDLISRVSTYVWRLLCWPYECSAWALTREWALAWDITVVKMSDIWPVSLFCSTLSTVECVASLPLL